MTDAFALLGTGMVLCAIGVALLAAWRGTRWPIARHKAWVGAAALVVFVLLWIPLGAAQIPVAAYVRGITGDFSVTLVSLAAWYVCHALLGWRAIATLEKISVLSAVAASALFLYPLALGWGDWDAYRPGWGSWGMLLALGMLCTVCWFRSLRVLPALVALALLAWSFGLMESSNLWDYLLDPWLSIYALGFFIRQAVKKVFIKCVRFVSVRSR